jgi:DNA repair protein RadB
MEMKIGSGCAAMDWLLDGGYEKDVLTTIYGGPGTGKTNFLLLALAHSAELARKRLIYIDTEGNFSVARLRQLTPEYEEVLKRTILLKPTTFEEQRKAFERLRRIVNEKVGVIMLDGAAMLYRLELVSKEAKEASRELGLQLSFLAEISRKKSIPVLVTNQVYTDIESDEQRTRMVGGDVLRYASKCLIEVKKLPDGTRTATLKKHRSLPEKSIRFRVTEDGVEQLEEKE